MCVLMLLYAESVVLWSRCQVICSEHTWQCESPAVFSLKEILMYLCLLSFTANELSGFLLMSLVISVLQVIVRMVMWQVWWCSTKFSSQSSVWGCVRLLLKRSQASEWLVPLPCAAMPGQRGDAHGHSSTLPLVLYKNRAALFLKMMWLEPWF